MSILIKGMKMPKNCDNCDLIQFDDEGLEAHCPLSPYYRWCGTPPDYIPEGCRLVEIPTPHGRLIDADRLSQMIHGTLCETCETFSCEKGKGCLIDDVFNLIDQAPTIIEAEVSEE